MVPVRLISLCALLLAAAPVHAGGVTLRLFNASSQPVEALSLFPLDADGEAVEDNLGGFYDPVAPGGEAQAALSADCGPMLAVVMLADGSDLRVKLDTCQDTLLKVGDPPR